MTQTDATLRAWLERAIAIGGPFDPAALFLGVATAVDDLGALTAMGDVTEATGAMATRQAIAGWTAPYKLNDGRWVADADPLYFSPANAGEAQALSHYFLASAAVAGTLKAFKPFAPPRNMVDQNSEVAIIVRVTIDPAGRFDTDVVFGNS